MFGREGWLCGARVPCSLQWTSVSIVAIIFESLSMQSSVFKALCSHCADDTWIG